MTLHDFRESLSVGEHAEKRLRMWLLKKYGIFTEPATVAQQRSGIDFEMRDHFCDWIGFGEVKFDVAAKKTGNVFVETTSNTTTGKDGWVFTSRSDCLFYVVDGVGIYQTTCKELVKMLDVVTAGNYKTGRARNNGYDSVGVLVPLKTFSEWAKLLQKL